MVLQLYSDVFPSKRSKANVQDMVLLHGWGMSSLVWDEIMPDLLKYFRVTVIDLPGFGRSSVPEGDYTLDYLSKHVLTVAPKKAVWMGWSLGALVAMNVAINESDRISALISIAGTPSLIQREGWSYGIPVDVMDQFSRMFDEDVEGTLIRFLALQAKGSRSQREDIRKLKKMLYFHGIPAPQALREGLNILRSVDLRGAVPDICCPTLHVFGDHDHLVPAQTAQGIKKLMPVSSVVRIEDVSHIPFVSNPESFLLSIQEFLSRCRA